MKEPNVHAIVSSTNTAEKSSLVPVQQVCFNKCVGNNISDWSFKLTHILSYVQNYSMSQVILKNDKAGKMHPQLIPVYSDIEDLRALGKEEKQLCFEFYQQHYFKFYLEIFTVGE